jgi:hypothetical protein
MPIQRGEMLYILALLKLVYCNIQLPNFIDSKYYIYSIIYLIINLLSQLVAMIDTVFWF